MSKYQLRLYICDLPPDCKEKQLHALLRPEAELLYVKWKSSPDGSELKRARVVVQSDTSLWKLLNRLNRRCVGELQVFVSPATPPPKGYRKVLRTSWRRGTKIGHMLDETNPDPLRIIARIVQVCGVRFALRLAKRAIQLQEAGGMYLTDGSRKRTTGGIFFFLVHQYLSNSVNKHLFYPSKSGRKKKKPQAVAVELSDPMPERPAPKPKSQPNSLDLVRQRLDALREEMRAAESELEAIKSGQASKSTGAFSLMKQLVDTQKAIDALLSEHPGLRQ